MRQNSLIRFNRSSAQRKLPQRKKTDNKSRAGKSLIIAGSRGMYGAAVLAATAAARVGSGYVTLMTKKQAQFSSVKHPDFLTLDLSQKISTISGVSEYAIGIGPGLGRSSRALQILKQLLKLQISNLVIDADALNLCAENKILSLPKTWIATPHEGELARLLNISSSVIRKNRHQSVLQAQKKLGCIVLLKGHKTLIADGKKVFEIQSGNSALAKAGTGDVLTGMITGFLAQGLQPIEAACLGAFVHGYIADQWVLSGRDSLSLMASDMIQELPESIYKIRNFR